jgi:hypothetical protein
MAGMTFSNEITIGVGVRVMITADTSKTFEIPGNKTAMREQIEAYILSRYKGNFM